MLRLLSEKSGLIGFSAAEDQEAVCVSEMQDFIAENAEMSIRKRELIRPEFQAAICTLNFLNDDCVVFSGIGTAYVLLFVFRHSIQLHLSGRVKQEIHDRGGHLLYIPRQSFRIQFQKNRDYQIIFLQYSEAFIINKLDEKDRPFYAGRLPRSAAVYYRRARICCRKTLDLLSMLMPDRHPEPGAVNWEDELVRSILVHFLNEKAGRFQPIHLTAAQLETFYAERDRLQRIANRVISFSRLLTLADVRDRPLFRKRLNQLYGMNIRDFIIETRMEMAADLLRDSDLSIKQIAAMTGYKNPFYFSHVFSHYFDQPPKSFRFKSNL